MQQNQWRIPPMLHYVVDTTMGYCSFSYCAITSLPRYHILYFDTYQGLEIFEIQTTCQSLSIEQRYGPCQKVML